MDLEVFKAIVIYDFVFIFCRVVGQVEMSRILVFRYAAVHSVARRVECEKLQVSFMVSFVVRPSARFGSECSVDVFGYMLLLEKRIMFSVGIRFSLLAESRNVESRVEAFLFSAG